MSDEIKRHQFYNKEYIEGRYASIYQTPAASHHRYKTILDFVRSYDLHHRDCLEIGCGRGDFGDLVDRYVGADLAITAPRKNGKAYVVADGIALPFGNNSFDAVWSVDTLEHIPSPETALQEIRRVVRPGGLLLLAPAWQCRPWAAGGCTVRSYSVLSLREKVVKASIPIRDSVFWRAPGIFTWRTVHLSSYLLTRRPVQLSYRELTPNYEQNWTSDSDAVNSIDPFEVILWFRSRDDQCLNYPTLEKQFLVRTGELIFRINKH